MILSKDKFDTVIYSVAHICIIMHELIYFELSNHFECTTSFNYCEQTI